MNIPDHELLAPIGKGAYGEVWLARNIMGTFRAVKIVYRKTFFDSTPFERELAGIKKFEPISRTHDGFVDILQIGKNEEEDCFYYVMEVADDLDHGQKIEPATYIPRTLGKERSRVPRFSVDQCVRIGMELCRALEHLHAKGLVHRDIKPSNIVFVNDVAKIADIGLVAEACEAHSFVGTEGFIPPEGPGTERADVYSLGKVLYEVATGRDRKDFPALPTGLSEFTDAESFLELNEILIKACRQHADERYQTAHEMFEDLALLASGKSLRKLRTLERRILKAKQVATVTAIVVAIAALLGFPIVQEKQHRAEMRARQIGAHLANGIHRLDAGDFLGSLPDFCEVYRLEEGAQGRDTVNATRIASILTSAPRLVRLFYFEDARINHLQFSKDGKRLLSTGRLQQVYLNDVATGASLATPFGPKWLSQAVFGADENTALTASETGMANLWDISSGRQIAQWSHTNHIYCARLSPDGKRLATGCKDGIARIWDAKSQTLIFQLKGHTAEVKAVEFSPNGKYIVTTSNDGTARLWDAQTGKLLSGPMAHASNWVVDAAFSPDSTILVTAGHDSWARRWKVPSGEELPTMMRHENRVSKVAFSPDGMIIATASMDGTVMLWDAATSQPLSENHVLPHSSSVYSLAFSPNGQQLATGCVDGTVRIWDMATVGIVGESFEGTINSIGTHLARVEGNDVRVGEIASPQTDTVLPAIGPIEAMSLSDDGQTFASVSASGKGAQSIISVRRVADGHQLFNVAVSGSNAVSRLTLSTNGANLAFYHGTRLRVFSTNEHGEWELDPALSEGSAEFKFDGAGRYLGIAVANQIAILDTTSRRELFPRQALEGPARNVAFNPSGTLAIACVADGYVNPQPAEIIDMRTGLIQPNLLWHRDGVVGAAFRDDGARLVTAGEERAAIVWDLHDLNKITRCFPPLLHKEEVRTVSFSRGSEWIGTITRDNFARVWDAETGNPVTPPIRLPGTNNTSLVFAPTGLKFYTIESPRRVWSWTPPRESRKAEDLLLFSRLLTSSLSDEGRPGAVSIARLWNELNAKDAGSFSVTKGESIAWHQREFTQSQKRKNKMAAIFHLRALRELQAGDTVALGELDRLERATQNLAVGER